MRRESTAAYRDAMRFEVTHSDTATELGSGDLPVLATPRLIAWMEAETVRCARPLLGPGETTVGTSIRITHRRPTAVGDSVEVSGEPPSTNGRVLTFRVRAVDDSGTVLASGEIDRAIVDRERFLDTVMPGSTRP